MAEEDDSQKTEDPSEKKLAKAREKGQVAVSQEVKSWAVLLGGAIALIFMSSYMGDQVRILGAAFIEKSHMIPVDIESLQTTALNVVMKTGLAMAPLLLLLLILAIAGNILQSGMLFAPEKIKPDTEKISLLKGLKRMFSSRSVIEFLKGILKLVIVAVVSIGLAVPMLGDIEILPGASLIDILQRMQDLTIVIVFASVAVMTAIAALDFVYQKYSFNKQMMMSKQEVKDEYKQAEGDPQVKAKIRALRQQRAQERMMANVPTADVVITNPTHYAVALKYEMEAMAAPKLIAKGVDTLAFRIRTVAEENDIPIIENPPLARALHASVELDEEIPPEHFVAVAEVIGYVMRLKGKKLH